MRKKRITALLLSAALAFSLLVSPVAAAPAFSDAQGHWAQQAIERWSQQGVIQGFDGAFRPDDTLTRAELAALLTRLMGYQSRSDADFADVPADAWYAPYVSLAHAAGVLLGDGTAMRPLDAITRQEAMCLLARALGVAEDAAALDRYTDGDQVADWAAGLVGGLTAQGYIQGSDGQVRPNAPITRAEAVTILNNAVAARYDSAGTISRDIQGDVIISAAGVTLKDMTIDGRLILAEGIGEGEVTLDGVTVTGDTLVRGGGAHSVILCGGTALEQLHVQRRDGAVRIHIQQDAAAEHIAVQPEARQVTIDGSVGAVHIHGQTPVSLTGAVETLTVAGGSQVTVTADARIAQLTVSGESARVDVAGQVEQLTVTADARQTAVTVHSGAVISQAHSAADALTVSGGGRIESMTVTGGQGVTIDKDTTVSDLQNQGDSSVSLGGTPIAPEGSGSQTPPASGGNGGSGGAGGSGGGSGTVTGQSVSSPQELTQALADPSIQTIRITGTLGGEGDYTLYTIDRPVTITGGTVYGTFLITADGVTLRGITFYNQGDMAGHNTLSRNAVNAHCAAITIENCQFYMTSQATGIVNGVLILPSHEQVSYTIQGNAFHGYHNSDAGFSSSALLISGGVTKAGLNPDSPSVLAQLTPEEDLAIITGNTYENCQNDYTRDDWSAGNQISCASHSSSDNFRLSYAAPQARFYVTGDVTRLSSTTIRDGSQLIVLPGATLTLNPGVTLTNQGELTVDGVLTGAGTLTDGDLGVGQVSGSGLIRLPSALAEVVTDFGFAKQEEPENIAGEMYVSTVHTAQLSDFTVTYGGQALEVTRTEYDSTGGDSPDRWRYAFSIPAQPEKSEAEYNRSPAVAAFALGSLRYELPLTTTVLDDIFGL